MTKGSAESVIKIRTGNILDGRVILSMPGYLWTSLPGETICPPSTKLPFLKQCYSKVVRFLLLLLLF